MDLVDEKDGALSHARARLRFGHDAAQIGNAGAHGGKAFEVRAGGARDHFGQRRLSRTGRTPEDHRRDRIAFDRAAQRAALSEDRLLSDELFRAFAGAFAPQAAWRPAT